MATSKWALSPTYVLRGVCSGSFALHCPTSGGLARADTGLPHTHAVFDAHAAQCHRTALNAMGVQHMASPRIATPVRAPNVQHAPAPAHNPRDFATTHCNSGVVRGPIPDAVACVLVVWNRWLVGGHTTPDLPLLTLLLCGCYCGCCCCCCLLLWLLLPPLLSQLLPGRVLLLLRLPPRVPVRLLLVLLPGVLPLLGRLSPVALLLSGMLLPLPRLPRLLLLLLRPLLPQRLLSLPRLLLLILLVLLLLRLRLLLVLLLLLRLRLYMALRLWLRLSLLMMPLLLVVVLLLLPLLLPLPIMPPHIMPP
jgi:hypothetical protein